MRRIYGMLQLATRIEDDMYDSLEKDVAQIDKTRSYHAIFS